MIFSLFSCSLATDKRVDSKSEYYYYSWNKKKVYFRKVNALNGMFPIPTGISKFEMDADAKTFVVLDNIIAKDKNHVFCWYSKVPDADAATFQQGYKKLYKDKNHVFYYAQHELKIVENADPETYTYYNTPEGLAKDKNGYFFWFKPMETDVPTFEVLSEYAFGAFDKDFIYNLGHIPIQKIPIQGKLTKVTDKLLYDNYQVFFFRRKLSSGYTLNLIPLENKKALTVYDSVKNTIFKLNGKLYWNDREITTMYDLKSFEYIGGDFAKDKYTVYRIRNIDKNNVDLLAADPATFRIIDGALACDKQTVFYGTGIISDADPHTIRKTEKGLEDKNYVWEWNNEKEQWNKAAK